MQYSVALKNISENDQLVLRLIFSLSEKAKGRNHSYTLSDNDQGEGADIYIQAASDNSPDQAKDTHNIIWFDIHPGPTDALQYIISKPLIASKVLCLLDLFIKQQQTITTSAQTISEEEVTPANKASVPESDQDVEFCISEEEASQLAIVDDETLSNPANLHSEDNNTPSAEQISADPENLRKVTSLVVLHNNKPVEVSKQAYDAMPALQEDSKPRALVVDDSPSVRKQIELELDLFNVDVDYAASLAEAMSQLANTHYDIAFLDVVLPDGDGFQICRNIKTSDNPATVIMLTGKATPADKVKGTMAGCDAYLVKPVGRMTFQNTVCNYLRLREQLELIQA